MKIETIPVTPIEQNCRIISNPETNNAVIVDPGGDVEILLDYLKSNSLNLQAIWLTHSHWDHCGGAADLKNAIEAPLYGHMAGKQLRELVSASLSAFRLNVDLKNCPEPEHYIDDGDEVTLDDIVFQVFYTPGHAPGHVVFYQPEQKVLLAGDTVFKGSIGRTDLPGGSFELLINSIRNKILTLPDDTQVLTGHGEDTDISTEKQINPFLKDL